MTPDEILRAAVECQLITTGNRDGLYADALVRFATLVRNAALEEAAGVCDAEGKRQLPGGTTFTRNEFQNEHRANQS